MSESKLRFGICGLGFMGRTHYSHLKNHAQAAVVALCDKDEARREGRWFEGVGNIGERGGEAEDVSGYALYADPFELVRDSNVDVVAVTLPTPLHADVTIAALEAGKHVFCEKPMARNTADCDRMIAAAKAADRLLMLGQCIRFWPQYELIKDALADGLIGDLQCLMLKRVSSPPMFASDNWYMDCAKSGGALFDLHVHDVDFAHYLLGKPQRVSAVGGRGPSGGVDHVVATYEYADGPYVVLEGGWSFHAPYPFEMAITARGTKGTLEWSHQAGAAVRHYDGGDKVRELTAAEGDGWTREMDYFLDCLQRGAALDRCQPESCRLSIELAALEQRAIETGTLQII